MSPADPPAEPRKRGKIIAVIVAIALAQGLALFAYDRVERRRAARDEAFASAAGSGEVVPSVDLERSDRTIVRSAALRGRPVLLHFWATWCPPCRAELPTLLALAERNRELDVVAVALEREWSPIASYLPGAIPTQVVRDPSDSLWRALGVSTLPDTYLLDAQGVVRARFRGARDWQSPAAEDALEDWIERIAAGAR